MARTYPIRRFAAVVFGAALSLGALSLASTGASAQTAFAEFVKQGQPALGRVESPPLEEGTHLSPGQANTYADPFPTSGQHDPRPLPARFYTTPQPMTRFLHAMEHGNVVVFYGKLPGTALGSFLKWGKLFRGAWVGLIVAPHPALEGSEKMVLVAWGKRLRLAKFDKPAVAAFIDAYAGRGPENRVR